MANALQDVAWEACLVEPVPDRSLEAYARRKIGIPHPSIRYFTSVPWLARAQVDLNPAYGLLMHLPDDVADLVALVVSQENSCRFCYAIVRSMLWSQGMSDARIERIERDLARADLPPRIVAALAAGRIQSRLGPAGAREAREILRKAGYSEEEAKEAAFAVATTDFGNRCHSLTAVPTQQVERMPHQFHMRLLRSLLRYMMQSRRSRGKASVPIEISSYPYADVVKAYAWSPIARALDETISAMWASPHLTRRCKLLILAVVARGLACEPCARDMGEALLDEGLEETTLQQILSHLDAPELDPIERLAVRFARETIWYEPATVQRRARALREQLSGPQYLEFVGVASLANALCRMGAVVSAEA
jgi:alkylhydroperoxidase family enzyme